MQELLVVFIFVLFAFLIYLPFLLKKRYPNRLWVGLVLCFISGTAQFYLPGGLKYFIGLFFLYFLLKKLIGVGSLALLIVGIISMGVIYWRFQNSKKY